MVPETKACENTPKTESSLNIPSNKCKEMLVATPIQRAEIAESLKEMTTEEVMGCRTSLSKKNQRSTAEIKAPMENAMGKPKTPILSSPSTFKTFATNEKKIPCGEKYLAKITAKETVKKALPKFMMSGKRVLPKA